MPTENYNLEDPAKQEEIRRHHHEYLPTAGKHGRYQPQQWIRGPHNEFPKMMGTGRFVKPTMADFKGQPDAQQMFDQALKEWDSAMTASIVRSKAEESRWLKANA
jgi:hypothetical protein